MRAIDDGWNGTSAAAAAIELSAEEVARLTGHLHQFEQVIAPKHAEPAGRTLDFLSQEMLREANTIASKSQDVEIARRVVEMKTAIDRIKEQAANAE